MKNKKLIFSAFSSANSGRYVLGVNFIKKEPLVIPFTIRIPFEEKITFPFKTPFIKNKIKYSFSLGAIAVKKKKYVYPFTFIPFSEYEVTILKPSSGKVRRKTFEVDLITEDHGLLDRPVKEVTNPIENKLPKLKSSGKNTYIIKEMPRNKVLYRVTEVNKGSLGSLTPTPTELIVSYARSKKLDRDTEVNIYKGRSKVQDRYTIVNSSIISNKVLNTITEVNKENISNKVKNQVTKLITTFNADYFHSTIMKLNNNILGNKVVNTKAKLNKNILGSKYSNITTELNEHYLGNLITATVTITNNENRATLVNNYITELVQEFIGNKKKEKSTDVQKVQEEKRLKEHNVVLERAVDWNFAGLSTELLSFHHTKLQREMPTQLQNNIKAKRNSYKFVNQHVKLNTNRNTNNYVIDEVKTTNTNLSKREFEVDNVDTLKVDLLERKFEVDNVQTKLFDLSKREFETDKIEVVKIDLFKRQFEVDLLNYLTTNIANEYNIELSNQTEAENLNRYLVNTLNFTYASRDGEVNVDNKMDTIYANKFEKEFGVSTHDISKALRKQLIKYGKLNETPKGTRHNTIHSTIFTKGHKEFKHKSSRKYYIELAEHQEVKINNEYYVSLLGGVDWDYAGKDAELLNTQRTEKQGEHIVENHKNIKLNNNSEFLVKIHNIQRVSQKDNKLIVSNNLQRKFNRSVKSKEYEIKPLTVKEFNRSGRVFNVLKEVNREFIRYSEQEVNMLTQRKFKRYSINNTDVHIDREFIVYNNLEAGLSIQRKFNRFNKGKQTNINTNQTANPNNNLETEVEKLRLFNREMVFNIKTMYQRKAEKAATLTEDLPLYKFTRDSTKEVNIIKQDKLERLSNYNVKLHGNLLGDRLNELKAHIDEFEKLQRVNPINSKLINYEKGKRSNEEQVKVTEDEYAKRTSNLHGTLLEKDTDGKRNQEIHPTELHNDTQGKRNIEINPSQIEEPTHSERVVETNESVIEEDTKGTREKIIPAKILRKPKPSINKKQDKDPDIWLIMGRPYFWNPWDWKKTR